MYNLQSARIDNAVRNVDFSSKERPDRSGKFHWSLRQPVVDGMQCLLELNMQKASSTPPSDVAFAWYGGVRVRVREFAQVSDPLMLANLRLATKIRYRTKNPTYSTLGTVGTYIDHERHSISDGRHPESDAYL